MLRYLADHRGTSDARHWMRLVNTHDDRPSESVATCSAATYMTQIRDWATSLFSDDVTGVTDARFLESSWNMRSIFPRLVEQRPISRSARYPLTVIPLSDASAGERVDLSPVASAYLRFTVPARRQASIDWSAGGLPVSPLDAVHGGRIAAAAARQTSRVSPEGAKQLKRLSVLDVSDSRRRDPSDRFELAHRSQRMTADASASGALFACLRLFLRRFLQTRLARQYRARDLDHRH